MKIIRKKIFETNSSSTHALVVPHNVNNESWNLNDSLFHQYDFGREESRLVDDWDEKLAYVYMVIKNFSTIEKIDLDFFKKRVNIAYNKVLEFVKYKPSSMTPKPNDVFKYIDSEGKDNLGYIKFTNDYRGGFFPYVDHSEDFSKNGFLERILKDDDFLLKLIFNKNSYITIGGDEYRGYNIKTIGFQYDYDEDYVNHGTEENPQYEDVGEFWDKLKQYQKENDVYLKGN